MTDDLNGAAASGPEQKLYTQIIFLLVLLAVFILVLVFCWTQLCFDISDEQTVLCYQFY